MHTPCTGDAARCVTKVTSTPQMLNESRIPLGLKSVCDGIQTTLGISPGAELSIRGPFSVLLYKAATRNARIHIAPLFRLFRSSSCETNEANLINEERSNRQNNRTYCN